MRDLTDVQLDGERAPEQIAADLCEQVQWLKRRRSGRPDNSARLSQ
jgi:hypothetical protein